jgi:hypothetical protein
VRELCHALAEEARELVELLIRKVARILLRIGKVCFRSSTWAFMDEEKTSAVWGQHIFLSNLGDLTVLSLADGTPSGAFRESMM